MLNLSSLMTEKLQAGVKGVPFGAEVRLGEVGAQGWNLLAEDLPFPVAMLRRSAIDHNSRWMAAFATRAGLRLCPHGKTTMAPQLFQRQLDDGAWGITAATTAHIHTYLKFGVTRILHANQLARRENIRGVLAALAERPEVDFYTLVDSRDGLEGLLQGLAGTPLGRPLQILIEIGVMGGRTGVRAREDAADLARRIKAASPLVSLAGIECFEGVFAGRQAGDDEGAQAVLTETAEIARALLELKLFGRDRPILSAGGSAFYDLVAQDYGSADVLSVFEPVLRSGCYLTHDSRHYEVIFQRIRARSPDLVGQEGLRPALEVWGVVQSRPEPDLVLVSLGKRDISYDIDLPRPLARYRRGQVGAPRALDEDHVTKALADQHLFLTVPVSSDVRVGDLMGFGVSHPCTTFDKWPLLFVVEDDYAVSSAVKTYF